MSGSGRELAGPFRALRSFADQQPAIERCDLCNAALPDRHGHLFSPARRELKCCCQACGMLFRAGDGTPWKPVHPRVERLELCIDDGAWAALQLPIDLAYFQRSSAAGGVRAFFPGPAGATESLLPEGAWAEMAGANPA